MSTELYSNLENHWNKNGHKPYKKQNINIAGKDECDRIYSNDYYTENIQSEIADALLERGYQIPEDYSVCGYDNLLYSKLLPLSITTVDNHLGQRAESAFELLQRNIDIHSNKPDVNFKNAQIKIAHPSILIVRKSTGTAKEV